MTYLDRAHARWLATLTGQLVADVEARAEQLAARGPKTAALDALMLEAAS